MLRQIFSGLVELVYPKTCPTCGRRMPGPGKEFVCQECWGKIKRNTPPFCSCCGRHLGKTEWTKNTCLSCQRSQFHFDRAFSPCLYDGVIKDLIRQFKYKGKDYLSRPLAWVMINFIKEYSLPMDYLDIIIPIPLHQVKLREREFNQAQILSRHIAEAFGKNTVCDNLLRSRLTRTQTDLEKSERLNNVKDSFSVNRVEQVRDKNILLIDDVFTTGATSSEAALALKKAGANIVFVLTLAN